jgi:hypothetical protein
MAGLLLVLPAQAATPCQALKDQRDQVARDAMQAEIALVHSVRLRLCAQEETLAEQANALAAEPSTGPQLNYGAYIRCRQRAEALLQRSRPVLYRNQLGFIFYTPAGAALARQSDALQQRVRTSCGPQDQAAS